MDIARLATLLLYLVFVVGCSSSGNVTRAKVVAPQTVNVPTHVPAAISVHMLTFIGVLESHGFIAGESQDPNALRLSVTFDPNPFAMQIAVALQQKGIPIAVGSATNHGWGTVIAEDTAISNLVSKVAKEFDSQLANLSARLEVVPELSASRAPAPRVKEPSTSTGTAFAVGSATSLLTAYHVVADARLVEVECGSNASIAASVVKIDPANDLALLSAPRIGETYLRLAPQDTVQSGDKVFSFGFPVSEILGKEPKYTEGVISSITGIGGAASLMQITVPIQPGNSGGPVVNGNGELVGIVTSSAAVETFFRHTGTLPQNVNWAVRAEYARPLLPAASIERGTDAQTPRPIDLVRSSVCIVYAQ